MILFKGFYLIHRAQQTCLGRVTKDCLQDEWARVTPNVGNQNHQKVRLVPQEKDVFFIYILIHISANKCRKFVCKILAKISTKSRVLGNAGLRFFYMQIPYFCVLKERKYLGDKHEFCILVVAAHSWRAWLFLGHVFGWKI